MNCKNTAPFNKPRGVAPGYMDFAPLGLNSDADVAGYRIYVGASADTLTLLEDVGLTNWITVGEAYQGQFIAVSAYDASGNEGARTALLNLEECTPGDVNCSGGIDLADALICLKIMAGISGGSGTSDASGVEL